MPDLVLGTRADQVGTSRLEASHRLSQILKTSGITKGPHMAVTGEDAVEVKISSLDTAGPALNLKNSSKRKETAYILKTLSTLNIDNQLKIFNK